MRCLNVEPKNRIYFEKLTEQQGLVNGNVALVVDNLRHNFFSSDTHGYGKRFLNHAHGVEKFFVQNFTNSTRFGKTGFYLSSHILERI